LKAANEELKKLGYISEYKWDGNHLLYFPGQTFNYDQERRTSARENFEIASLSTTLKHPAPENISTPHDPLLPALNLFAQGNWMAEDRLKQLGITVAQAEALCIEKGIPINSTH